MTYLRKFTLIIGTMLAAAVLLLAAAMLTSPAQAQVVPWHAARISWTAPTQYTDGSPIGTAAITYSVEQRAPGATAFSVITPTPISATTLTVANLQRGVHTFRVSAIVGGVSSTPSNGAGKDIINPPPQTVTITVE